MRQHCEARLRDRLQHNFSSWDRSHCHLESALEWAAETAAGELERSLFATAMSRQHYNRAVAAAVVEIDRCSRGCQRYYLPDNLVVGATTREVAAALTGACAECQQALGGKGWRCGQCKQVAYCGAKCQSRHWRLHKRTCKM